MVYLVRFTASLLEVFCKLSRSWSDLGGFSIVFESFWRLGEAPGGARGGPGELQGGSWGGPWGCPGRSWSDLGPILTRLRHQMRFWIDFGVDKAPPGRSRGEPFGRQNGAKIDTKTRSKLKIGKMASWKRLEWMSARFWSRWEVNFQRILLEIIIFPENGRFSC